MSSKTNIPEISVSSASPEARQELEAKSKAELIDLLLDARSASLGHIEQERHQQRRRLEEVLESLNDAFVLYDVDGNLVYANSKFGELYPFNKSNLIPGVSFETLFRNEIEAGLHPGVSPDDEEFITKRVVEFFKGELTAVRQHSSGRWTLVTDRKTPAGEIVGLRTDITDLKNREEAAEAANNSKTEFLGNMSHELRTPLNAIIGFSSILVGQMFGPLENAKYLDYAGDINRSGEHLLKLINDLLDISRIEAGEVIIDKVELSVADVVHSCFSMVRTQADAVGVLLVDQVDQSGPKILADDRQFRQILLNLLSNAIKFTPEGGTVTITAQPDAVHVDMVTIAVSDTGIGIPPEDLSRVLEPFGQVEGTKAQNPDGTGLGLPIVKSLVEMQGGSFDLASEAGKGSTATIRMPVS
jgi:PAS domain S-box-containing protein